MKAHISLIALLTVSLPTVVSLGATKVVTASAKKTPVKPVAPVPVEKAPAEEPESPVVAAPADSHPMEDLKKSHIKLQKLMGKSSPSWSPENDAKTQELRAVVNGFLDFRELAQRALVKHWDGIEPAKRAAFVSTLRELVERNYIDQMNGSPNYKLSWDKEELKPTEATVLAQLNTMARGKPLKVAMEYRLVHKQRGWVVYDVVTDEQSLLETYRAEFNKVIKKESFDALLAKLKQKLEEKKQNARKSK
jgi:phospholipid transport system substrate-binding protein